MKTSLLFLTAVFSIHASQAATMTIRCNDNNVIFDQRSATVPEQGSYGSRMVTVYMVEASIEGNNRNGQGVLDYLVAQNAISRENLLLQQTYDPVSHTYPTVARMPLSTPSQKEPYEVRNGIVLETRGVGPNRRIFIQLEQSGSLLIRAENGASWRYERCYVR